MDTTMDEDDDDDQQLSLNIVVEASPAVQHHGYYDHAMESIVGSRPTKKRKRLNKYEKRRRKAAAAKEQKLLMEAEEKLAATKQQQQQPDVMSEDDDSEPRELNQQDNIDNNDNNKNDGVNNNNDIEENSPSDATSRRTDKSQEKASDDDDEQSSSINCTTKTREYRALDRQHHPPQKNRNNLSKNPINNSHENDNDDDEEDNDNESNNPDGDTTQHRDTGDDDKAAKYPPNPQQQNQQQPQGHVDNTNSAKNTTIDDDADHAAYMAEYHARPMELDRRNDATIDIRNLHKNNKNKKKKKKKLASHGNNKTTATAENNNTDDTNNNNEENSNNQDDQHGIFALQTEWKDLALHDKLVSLLTTGGNNKYAHPTRIQAKVLRAMLPHSKNENDSKSNVWIQSETGSGKTLAYFLPILQQLYSQLCATTKKKDRAEWGTPCLIVCPTQELVQQTCLATSALLTKVGAGQLVAGSLQSQASRSKEKARIRKGLAVIVATPGRLLDHLKTTTALQFALRKLQFVVLDEVDRLFDLGMGPQLQQIIVQLQQFSDSKWRSILVSATVPPTVRTAVQEALSPATSNVSSSKKDSKTDDKDWIWIQADDNDGNASIQRHGKSGDDAPTNNSDSGRSLPQQLHQYHVLVSAKLRLTTLVAFLVDRVAKGDRTLVFLSTCASVDYYHALFSQASSIMTDNNNNDNSNKKGLFGPNCQISKLHGNIAAAERHSTLADFTSSGKNDSTCPRILLATDVAARGLNLHADWIVQYDPPCELADYIHRAGRVARAGAEGNALLFLLPSEKSLLDILQAKQQSVTSSEQSPSGGGPSQIPALSLTSTLQQAAKLCRSITNLGLQRNGMKVSKNDAKTSDSSNSGNRHNGQRQAEAFCSEVQYRLEECVLEQSKLVERENKKNKKAQAGKKRKQVAAANTWSLLDMARAAFLSHMRAYPTKEKLVRHIFSVKALHLGHMAKSFALRETPKTLVKNSNNSGIHDAMAQQGRQKRFKKSKTMAVEEEDQSSSKVTAAQKRAMLMANAAKLQMGNADGF